MRVHLSQALRLMLFLGTMGLPCVLPAQRWLVAEAGTFLTREGGWKWELNVAGSLGIMHVVAPGWRGTARVLGRVSACPCGSMPSIPAPVESIENGVGAGYDVLRQLGRSRFHLLGGAEWFQVLGESQARGSTLLLSGGGGAEWGADRAWGVQLRYGAFARRLAETRGRLELGLLRRW